MPFTLLLAGERNRRIITRGGVCRRAWALHSETIEGG
jgi:hypothetical protein